MERPNSSNPELSLIVPTYNERENIFPLVESIHKALSGYTYEIIIVDDNSPDGTAAVARNLSQQYPVSVIVRTNERGLASAVVAGFQQARGEILGVIDADLQHPPEYIPALLKSIRDGADVAIASRYIPGGGIEGWALKREIISKGAKLPAQLLFSKVRKIKDPLSGFFLLKRKVIDNVELKPIGYKILLEVLARGHATRVVEVPFTFRERERGQSNLTAKEQINYLKHLYRLVASDEGGIKRFLRFCVVGASGALVNLGFLIFFVEVFGANKLWAQIPSYEISILTNFAFNEFWTFRDRRIPGEGSFFKRMLKFNLVSLVGWGINFATYTFALKVLGINYIIAQMLAILVAMTWNFVSNVFWTWRVKSKKGG